MRAEESCAPSACRGGTYSDRVVTCHGSIDRGDAAPMKEDGRCPGSDASWRAGAQDQIRRGGWREVDAGGEETRAVAGMRLELRVWMC